MTINPSIYINSKIIIFIKIRDQPVYALSQFQVFYWFPGFWYRALFGNDWFWKKVYLRIFIDHRWTGPCKDTIIGQKHQQYWRETVCKTLFLIRSTYNSRETSMIILFFYQVSHKISLKFFIYLCSFWPKSYFLWKRSLEYLALLISGLKH